MAKEREQKVTLIKDLRPGLKNLQITFIVLDIERPTKTKDGHEVRSCKVADKTGSINMSLWDELGEIIQSGDIIRLTKGYSSMYRNHLTLYSGQAGKLQKVGEYCMIFSETPNMSEPNPEFLAQAKINMQDGRSNSPTGSNQGMVQQGPNKPSNGVRLGNSGGPPGNMDQQHQRPPTPPPQGFPHQPHQAIRGGRGHIPPNRGAFAGRSRGRRGR
ncbi:SOSS complex subunit B1-A-like [Lytechinus pictus]|uniref:SOSS complex subunit B1-A-like n=1 Tax=Lytechinus pictus TaxID=7653 RepID=UPI00240E6246|nr:SOSS complex subunit B1-A-like [Lytechinus pictus]